MAGVSFVRVAEQAIEEAGKMSRRGASRNWMILKLDGEKDVVLDLMQEEQAEGTFEEKWEKFVSSLPEKEPRYAIYNFTYMSPTDKVERGRQIFIRWCPSGCSMKERMMSTMYSKAGEKE